MEGQTPEVPPTETPAASPDSAVTPAAEPKRESISPQLAAILRKEKAANQKLSQAKAIETQMLEMKAKHEAELAEYKSKLMGYEDETDPLKLLERKGWDYTKLTDHVLKGDQVTPQDVKKAAKEEFDRYRAEEEKKQADERQKLKEAEEARISKEHEDARNTFKSEIDAYLESNKEKYEITELYGKRGDVFDLIQAHYQQGQAAYEANPSVGPPKVLSIEEASDLVEKFWIEQWEMGRKAKKFQPKEEPKPEPAKSAGFVATPPKTLTNTLAATTSATKPKFRSEQERMAAALAKL